MDSTNENTPPNPPENQDTQPSAPLRLQPDEPAKAPTPTPTDPNAALQLQPEDAQVTVPKKKTLSITIKDKAVLYAAYMPFLKSGGLFIPTKKAFNMGEDCSLVITLVDEANKYSVDGKVVWITPPGSPTNKAGGIGIEFAENTDGELVRRKIEDILGVMLKSDNATHTM